ncbi:hypothetical protein V5799_011256 [Amblyomma americanum]|uniref:CCHC-type domain-containing protein n=1 Tax=Amblyomma americanum TaxID=6943 RepID=A0AAQ4EHL9_AMBAM
MPRPIILQQPRVPPTFNGSLGEDPEEWFDQFELVASFNKWDNAAKIEHAFFSLDGSARTWYENYESSLTTWELFKRELLKVFTSVVRKERAERLLESRIQLPNEPVCGYIEEMKRLFRRADPGMTEEKKVPLLMRGGKEQLFGSLVRQPPTTVEEFMQEACTIAKTLDVRARQYNRPSYACAIRSDTPATTSDSLREAIREIVREELRRLLPSSPQPQAATLMDVVREEVQQALVTPTATEPQAMTYAAALRTAQPQRQPPRPPRDEPLFPQRRLPAPARSTYDRRSSPRKCDAWRTSDNRPLCFHCGEAGHILRHCPYRRMGLRGFAVNAPRPRFGQRPQEIDEYLRREEYTPNRFSRSPSPSTSHFLSPRRSYAATVRGRSSSPVGETKSSNLWR